MASYIVHLNVQLHHLQGIVMGHQTVDFHLYTPELARVFDNYIPGTVDVMYHSEKPLPQTFRVTIASVKVYPSLQAFLKCEGDTIPSGQDPEIFRINQLYGKNAVEEMAQRQETPPEIQKNLVSILLANRCEEAKWTSEQIAKHGILAFHITPPTFEIVDKEASINKWACQCVIRAVAAGPNKRVTLSFDLVKLILVYIGGVGRKDDLPFYLRVSPQWMPSEFSINVWLRGWMKRLLSTGKLADADIIDARNLLVDEKALPKNACEFCINKATGEFIHHILHIVYPRSDILPLGIGWCNYIMAHGRPCFTRK